MSISKLIRTDIPFILIAVLGIITLSEYYIVDPTIRAASLEAGNWVVVISGFVLMMATVRGVLYNIRQIRDRRPGIWPYSIYFLALTAVYIAIGLIDGVTGPIYSWLQTWFFAAGVSAAGGTLSAYLMLSTAFRAFRMRSIAGGALVISMAVFLIYLTAIGDFIPGLVPVGKWLFDVPLSAGFRGILMGSGIGAVYIGLRTILGRERRVLGG